MTYGEEKDRPTLLHVFPTFAVGGLQTRFCDIANHFGGRFSHLVISLDGNTEARERLARGVPVTLLPYRAENGGRALLRIAAQLAQLRPDLLLTYNWGSMDWVIANLLAAVCPLIHTEDGFNADEAAGQKLRRVWARRLFLRKAAKVVVPSLSLKAIAEISWKLDPLRVKYLPNGVDLSAALTRGAPDVMKDFVTIGTVASIRSVKNIGRLIRLFKRLDGGSRIRLSIVGDGPDLGSLREQAGDDPRIVFHGYQADPYRYIGEMDVFALTSDSEQMPIAVVEAMAMGKPVAATDVGDVKTMVAASNKAFVIPAHREDDLMHRLNALILDREARRSIGADNRKKCLDNFDINRMFSSYEAMYLAETARGPW